MFMLQQYFTNLIFNITMITIQIVWDLYNETLLWRLRGPIFKRPGMAQILNTRQNCNETSQEENIKLPSFILTLTVVFASRSFLTPSYKKKIARP